MHGRTVRGPSGEFFFLDGGGERNKKDGIGLTKEKTSFCPKSRPKNQNKTQGSFIDTTDPNEPILTPCPAESYCPGGTTLTPVSCPAGTGTLGSPGSRSADQCVPQDPCVPNPNTCCSGSSTQPGWPQYGPYFCVGVGGLCTNTAVDKNVSFCFFLFGSIEEEDERRRRRL